ncbi:polysaccharide deacetylase [Ahniella affigens]|uniref:Polysaccharide deacetylase n=2 Tax=Ahniella affigens TaxID=2021234 RepID=A0A2P1PQB6_9GAMM|nr:polysaccharide deacetylase [Ahniella affigens]
MWRRWQAWVLLLPLLLIMTTAAVWNLCKSRTFQVAGVLVARVETEAPMVALTFDDGPNANALAALLPILAAHGVQATFFVTGAELERHPELGQQLLAAGHELGNHSFSHQRMVFKSAAFVENEIERTDALIRAAGAEGEILFRPPYGAKGITLPRYLERTGRRTIMWDVEPDSKRGKTATSERITETTLAETRPGSIILLHVMYPSRQASLAAVPRIIEGLKARGYNFVTVSALLDSTSPTKAQPSAMPEA